MTPRLPAPVLRMGLSAFRRLPAWARRRAVQAGTPGYTLGALLVLQNPAGEVLLVRQRHLGGWALPGGLLQSGESPAEAVAREVREEVGLSVDVRADLPRALVDPDVRRVDLVFTATWQGAPPGSATVPVDGATAAVTVDGVETLEAGWFAGAARPECATATEAVLRLLDAAAL